MRREKVDWNYLRLGLHKKASSPIDARVRQKCVEAIQPQNPEKQYQPYPSALIRYGSRNSTQRNSRQHRCWIRTAKKIKKACGKFLFLGRVVDSTLLCPIGSIASKSSHPTEDTMKHTQQLLDYIATQEESVITYNASNMKLAAHSNASYLSKPQARSQAGGHFFLSKESKIPQNNEAVLNIAHIIKHVMTSSTESELAALYIMAREAVYIRIILEELGHKQPPTPLQTDNSMADAVCNGKVHNLLRWRSE